MLNIEEVRASVQKLVNDGKSALDSFEAGHVMTELELERLLLDGFVLPFDQLLDGLRERCER